MNVRLRVSAAGLRGPDYDWLDSLTIDNFLTTTSGGPETDFASAGWQVRTTVVELFRKPPYNVSGPYTGAAMRVHTEVFRGPS